MGSVVGGLAAIGVLGFALWHYWRRSQAGDKAPVQPIPDAGDHKIQERPTELPHTAKLELDGVERTELPGPATPELDGVGIVRHGVSERNMRVPDIYSQNLDYTGIYTITS